MFSKFLIVLAFGFIALSAYAEGPGSSGGGSLTESQMQSFLNRLDDYLYSAQGKQELSTWLDVDAYDKAHPDHTLKSIIESVHPVLLKQAVYYNKIERDCVSDSKTAQDKKTLVRYFQCNLNHLPELPASDETDEVKSVYYLYVYRLTFHEVLAQAGLEDQSDELHLTNLVPSNYNISSHLEVRVVKDWIPGKEAPQTVIPQHQLNFDDARAFSHFLESDVGIAPIANESGFRFDMVFEILCTGNATDSSCYLSKQDIDPMVSRITLSSENSKKMVSFLDKAGIKWDTSTLAGSNGESFLHVGTARCEINLDYLNPKASDPRLFYANCSLSEHSFRSP